MSKKNGSRKWNLPHRFRAEHVHSGPRLYRASKAALHISIPAMSEAGERDCLGLGNET
ncbi:protein of unknown function [Candidatus Filomicrobium marinum]|nr:protein of unknown function [Candidatus Filomicrobium marinum]